nr:GntR family transcriptional regulator [Paraburkholderia fungorum]
MLDDDSDRTDTAQNRAYMALKNAVLAGHFYPGTVLSLRELAASLGTSEMPIREALKRLTAEGAFEAMPNRSARVPILSKRQLEQVLALRVDLESQAVAQAAENISRRHIDELALLQEQMEHALDEGNFPLYVSLNKQFHFAIYTIADNDTLLALIEALWLRMAPVVSFNLTLAANAAMRFDPSSRAHHFEILEALRSGDAAKAAAQLRADLLHPAGFSEYWESSARLAQSAPPSRKRRPRKPVPEL